MPGHPGHIRLLESARSLGDILILALNTDSSVQRLKGPTRPLIRQEERAELAAALQAVGAVVFPSDANYLVAGARGAVEALRARGIAVRDCGSFGLPDHVRLAAPRPADLATVLRALAELDDGA